MSSVRIDHVQCRGRFAVGSRVRAERRGAVVEKASIHSVGFVCIEMLVLIFKDFEMEELVSMIVSLVRMPLVVSLYKMGECTT